MGPLVNKDDMLSLLSKTTFKETYLTFAWALYLLMASTIKF